MLYLYFIKYRFITFLQSGFYFDFFFKKISEVILRNLLVYSALFFGEKYYIEYLTKKVFEKNINIIVYLFNNKYVSYRYFFFNLFFFIFIIHIILILLFLII